MAAALKKRAKRSKKTRKVGHNKAKPCHIRYTSERRWITNKRRQLQKHLSRHPADRKARAALAKTI